MAQLRQKFFPEICHYGFNAGGSRNVLDNVNTIYGLGSGTSGYYQTPIGQTGTCMDKLTWLALRTAVTSCAEHQGITLNPALPATTLLDDPKPVMFRTFRDDMVSPVAQITTNKALVDAASVAVTVDPNTVSQTRTTAWSTTVAHIFTVTALDQDHFRGFFNAGGQIRFAASRTGGSATTQNTDWTNLLSGAGSYTFDATDFFALTTSYVSKYNVIGTGAYAANDWDISAMTNTVTDGTGRGGKGTVLTFRVQYNDDHIAIGAGPDTVDGTLTSDISIRNVDGTPLTIAAPTFATTTAL